MQDGSEDRYTFQYSLDESCEPTVTICRAVAWRRRTSVAELEPLARTIDTDALNELFDASEQQRQSRRSPSDPDLRVTFEYGGLAVTVEPGRIAID